MATMTSGEPIAAKGRADTLVYPIAVARGQLVTALVAGFVATHIATVSGYWFHGVNLPDLGWPNFNGILLLGVKAILFALVLATISAIWWVPQLFNSVFNYNFGWFSQNLGKFLGVSAWKAVVGIYVWHIIYGVNLGLIYNPHPAEA